MSLDAHPLVRDWLRADGDGLVLRTGKVDLGQRISTALMRIAAEETTLPFDRIDVAPVRTGDSPDEGITSGSNSILQSGRAQRLACATARGAALALVAERLGVAADTLDLADGQISHRATNRQFDLVETIADLPADLRVDPQAAPRVLDASLPDLEPRGLRQMVEGRFAYVHDLDRPGMLHARIVRPPMGGARLAAVDPEAEARWRDAGLTIVREDSFLAVAGPREWPVVRAAQSLATACQWDIGEGLETGDIFEIMQARDAQRFAVLDGTPSQDAPVPDPVPDPDFEARYERPYTMHGALAPSAALAEWTEGKLEILTHSQGIYFLRDSIADSLGLNPESVVLQHTPGSGCYGHNGADDAAFDAALVARAIPDTPILLKYMREDEHGLEPLGTAMTVSVAGDLDQSGDIAALWMEARGDTHRGRPRAGPNRAGAARLVANSLRDADVPRFVPEPNMGTHAGLHRNLDPIYRIPDKRMVKALVPDLPMRPSALRCLGAPTNVLAMECTMDDLARRAGCDPIDYRRRHLDDPRAIAVLDALADRLPKLAEGSGRGIAYAQYKNAMTRVGLAVDLTVDDLGAVRLQAVHLVADAGRVVDPDGLCAQLEGGVLQGASWALHERVVWGREGRESLDWDSYPVLRFDNVPPIDITLIGPSDAPSVGAGEASPGPTVAAIANGIFDATGLRLRRMPFDADTIMGAALQA
ncbi:molybdopterin cofactor-binding domain-containing protein [Aestuariicoccus sp. MJ-SS9]|uniref:molybdopterin cofactor-binding domain-containing protein n=1 Tax=Aestuariicoccus sp. MJ-SS9 TaxID=3079855 RepID=UPI0029141405|nr:molybdopterin cofactor-binding domain-containing protein [Aestuariicoccus sp. MJ-SS9]MDU8911932.1 molybdopterin cofactor-binding domain-containing protein [Aestuariicoccus sp. MJ-SS9]